MAWNREVAREVSVQLDRRRQRALREAADRKREALEAVPGLRQVEQELGELGARIAREALLAADPGAEDPGAQDKGGGASGEKEDSFECLQPAGGGSPPKILLPPMRGYRLCGGQAVPVL